MIIDRQMVHLLWFGLEHQSSLGDLRQVTASQINQLPLQVCCGPLNSLEKLQDANMTSKINRMKHSYILM